MGKERHWWWFEIDTHYWRHTDLYYNLANSYPHLNAVFFILFIRFAMNASRRRKNAAILPSCSSALHSHRFRFILLSCAKLASEDRYFEDHFDDFIATSSFPPVFSILIWKLCPAIETASTKPIENHTLSRFMSQQIAYVATQFIEFFPSAEAFCWSSCLSFHINILWTFVIYLLTVADWCAQACKVHFHTTPPLVHSLALSLSISLCANVNYALRC